MAKREKKKNKLLLEGNLEVEMANCEGMLDYEWVETKEGTVRITGYSGTDTQIIIPAQIARKSVTIIGYAFRGCSNLTKIDLPESVKIIEEEAFRGCSSLTSINVDADNLSYSSVDGILFNKDQTILYAYPKGKAGSFVIPASVTSIEYCAFSDCSSLTSVTIPVSVISIEQSTFSGCNELTIYGIEGSYAQQYASENDIPFKTSILTTIPTT